MYIALDNYILLKQIKEFKWMFLLY